MSWGLCFPIMPLYSGSLYSLPVLAYVSTSWLAVRALCSDSPLPTTLSPTWARAETDQFTPLQLSMSKTVQFKQDFKEKATTNEIKHEPEKKRGEEAAAELLPNESNATANVSLLAHSQRLSTAALMAILHTTFSQLLDLSMGSFTLTGVPWEFGGFSWSENSVRMVKSSSASPALAMQTERQGSLSCSQWYKIEAKVTVCTICKLTVTSHCTVW